MAVVEPPIEPRDAIGFDLPKENPVSIEFHRATLPWVDRDDFAEQLARRRASGQIDDTDAARLEEWHRDGFVCIRGLVDRHRIDALIADVERAWSESAKLQALVEGRGAVWLEELPPRDELGHHHYRLLDVQDWSEAAREILLQDDLLRFIRLAFDDVPVAMQTLFFDYGSEQGTHQDFPYVQAQIPSHLMGCWIACEPVDDDNGPLVYYPGSHRLPKFDWGGGELLFDGEDPARNDAFEAYLERQIAEHQLERQVFHADAGDVVFWHAALVHAGSPAVDPSRTRRSLVAHYSDARAYPRDRRSPAKRPRVHQANGGRIYLRQDETALDRLRGKLGGLKRRLLG